MQISFFFADATVTLKNRNRLKRFIANIFKSEHTKLTSINYIFCSDRYLLDINQRFLFHDDYTDVITFNLSATENVEGEIYISVDRIRENALTHRKALYNELHRVIFHGALHLCGYKDKTEKEILAIRNAEDQYLNLYFVKRST